jgi:hypothetical protein
MNNITRGYSKSLSAILLQYFNGVIKKTNIINYQQRMHIKNFYNENGRFLMNVLTDLKNFFI